MVIELRSKAFSGEGEKLFVQRVAAAQHSQVWPLHVPPSGVVPQGPPPRLVVHALALARPRGPAHSAQAGKGRWWHLSACRMVTQGETTAAVGEAKFIAEKSNGGCRLEPLSDKSLTLRTRSYHAVFQVGQESFLGRWLTKSKRSTIVCLAAAKAACGLLNVAARRASSLRVDGGAPLFLACAASATASRLPLKPLSTFTYVLSSSIQSFVAPSLPRL